MKYFLFLISLILLFAMQISNTSPPAEQGGYSADFSLQGFDLSDGPAAYLHYANTLPALDERLCSGARFIYFTPVQSSFSLNTIDYLRYAPRGSLLCDRA